MDRLSDATVLVTGARAPVALDCARAFAAAGAQLHLADSVTPWAARWSRLAAPIHRLPPPRHDYPAFRRALGELVERHRFSAIVPTCEEVFYVAHAAAVDGYAARVFVPDPATLARLHSKHQFAQFARSLDLPAPITRRITKPEQLCELATGRLVLKPEYSRFAMSALIRPTSAQAARVRPSPDHPWVAQDHVAGEEICLWSAVREGRVTALAAYRPRRRHGRSAAYCFEAIDCPAAEDVAHRIAAATGMTGHLSFDIMLTPDGLAVPIECNPRAVSGLHLLDASPALAKAMLDGAGDVLRPTPGTLRHLSPAMALLGLPTAGRGLPGLVADWRAGRDCIGRPGDRWPVLGAIVDAARFAAVGLSRARSPSGQTTDDIEWNGGPIE